jgi:hypothetical protein
LSKLLIGFGVLRFQLGILRGETASQIFDLADSLTELIETDVKMPLFLFKLLFLLVEETNVVLDTVPSNSGLATWQSTHKSRKCRGVM